MDMEQVNNSMFTWVPFYKELASRLLDFKHDRATLYKLTCDVFRESSTGLIMPFNGRGKRFDFIDPFSVFALLNRRITDDKKRELQKSARQVFGIKAESPTDFEGIPHADNRKAFFFPADIDPAPYVDNLWKMFEIAIAYAGNPTERNRDLFVRQYQLVENQKGINRNLTIGLFWIRPEFYVAFDGNNERCVFDSGEFLPEFVGQFSDLRKDLSSGLRYLAFREAIIDALKKTRFGTAIEFSRQAYLSAKAYKLSEKQKADSVSRSAKLGDLIRKPVQETLNNSKTPQEFVTKIAALYKTKKVQKSLDELLAKNVVVTERVIAGKQRVGQEVFREVVLENYGRRCCISGLPIVELLEACHIAGWSESEDGRIRPDNGLCLAVIYHRAFDNHLIAIDKDYRLVISKGLKKAYPEEICREMFYKYENKKISLPKRFPPNKLLLANHFALLKKGDL